MIILLVIGASCHCSKKNSTQADKNNLTETTIPSNTPACIDSMIKIFKEEDITNPPRKIYSYTYRNNTVYYVPALCCDFFSELYDTNCTLIGHPDGGFSGKGDGSMTDFFETRKNEVLIWEDERTKGKQSKNL